MTGSSRGPGAVIATRLARGDITYAVSFLASEHAGSITGQRIVVDGGCGLGP